MKVGPTKFSPGGTIQWSHYAETGETAILIMNETTGEPELKATVCLRPPATRAGPDEVSIKTWSENEGVYEALVEAGVIEACHEMAQAGHVEALLCRLTAAARAELALHYAGNPKAAQHRDSLRASHTMAHA